MQWIVNNRVWPLSERLMINLVTSFLAVLVLRKALEMIVIVRSEIPYVKSVFDTTYLFVGVVLIVKECRGGDVAAMCQLS